MMSLTNVPGTRRYVELCGVFDRLRTDELLPLALSLGIGTQSGAPVPPDVVKALALTLYGRGLPRAALSEPFLAAMRAALTVLPPGEGGVVPIR